MAYSVQQAKAAREAARTRLANPVLAALHAPALVVARRGQLEMPIACRVSEELSRGGLKGI